MVPVPPSTAPFPSRRRAWSQCPDGHADAAAPRAHRRSPAASPGCAAPRSATCCGSSRRPGCCRSPAGSPRRSRCPTARVAGRARPPCSTRTGPTGPTALQYGPTEGLDELRALVAPGTAGSPALGAADDVLVTTGSQQAIGLVVRALVDPGATVVVEDPLYLGTRQVLDACDARLVPIPVDARRARRRAARRRPRRAGSDRSSWSWCPTTRIPRARRSHAERRAALGALAVHYGFVILEDDPYHGLGFAGRAARARARPTPPSTRSRSGRRRR